jgi:hypothetical protein
MHSASLQPFHLFLFIAPILLALSFLAFHSASLQPLLFPIFFGLIGLFRLCPTHFRLNGGVGAGFRRNAFGVSATFPFISLYRSLLVALHFLAFHSASLQPLLFLLFFCLIGPFRQLGTHFRLNGGVGAGFRRNTFGVAATRTFLFLYRSLLLALPFLAFHSASLQPLLFLLFFCLIGPFRQLGTHFRLNGNVGAGFDGMHSASLQPFHLFLFIAPYSLLFLFWLSIPRRCTFSFSLSSSVSSALSDNLALTSD